MTYKPLIQGFLITFSLMALIGRLYYILFGLSFIFALTLIPTKKQNEKTRKEKNNRTS